MNEVTKYLYHNLPLEIYKNIYQKTVKLLFLECDIINGYLDLEDQVNLDVELCDLIGIQTGEIIRFNYEDMNNNNYMVLSKHSNCIDHLLRLLTKGILKFKVLKVYSPSCYTPILMKQSGYIYTVHKVKTWNKDLEASNVVEFDGKELGFSRLKKIVSDLQNLKVVIKYTLYPVDSIERIIDIISYIVEPFVNVELCLNCFFLLGDEYIHNLKDQISEFNSMCTRKHPRIKLSATTIFYLKEYSTNETVEQIGTLVKKMGYNHITRFIIDSTSKKEFDFNFKVVEKLMNLESISVRCNFKANINTLGDLRSTKLRKITFNCDCFSHDWVSNYLPDSLHALKIFKSAFRRNDFLPIKVSPSVNILTLTHEDEYMFSLDPTYLDLSCANCQVVITPRNRL